MKSTKNFWRVITLALALVMLFSVVACGNGEEPAATTEAGADSTAAPTTQAPTTEKPTTATTEKPTTSTTATEGTGTTGGTEIVARLLERRWPHIPIGKLLLAVDGVVIALSALVYGQLESPLYAVVLVFVS